MFVSNPETESYPGHISRDTLIMTEIEFLPAGGFRASRYWYLMPPFLHSGLVLHPNGSYLETKGAWSWFCEEDDEYYPLSQQGSCNLNCTFSDNVSSKFI